MSFVLVFGLPPFASVLRYQSFKGEVMDYLEIINNLAIEIVDTIAEAKAVFAEKSEILNISAKNSEKTAISEITHN